MEICGILSTCSDVDHAIVGMRRADAEKKAAAPNDDC